MLLIIYDLKQVNDDLQRKIQIWTHYSPLNCVWVNSTL